MRAEDLRGGPSQRRQLKRLAFEKGLAFGRYADLRLSFRLSWGLRPRLYAVVRFTDCGNTFLFESLLNYQTFFCQFPVENFNTFFTRQRLLDISTSTRRAQERDATPATRAANFRSFRAVR